MKTNSALPSFPNGWFCVGFSDEIAPGKLKSVRFNGQDAVLFRTASGVPVLIDAYCPHMGAHFAHGGEVEGENIRCPFHGFCFNSEGACTKTGYGTKPPAKAIARTWPIHETAGAIFAWHHIDGDAPQWGLPDLPMDDWSPLSHTTWELESHPQEIAENSVDIGHLTVVHGYDKVEALSDLDTSTHCLRAKYAMSRDASIFGQKEPLRAEFQIQQWGLGAAFVHVEVKQYNLRSRHYVMPTQLDDGKINLRVAVSIHRGDDRRPMSRILAALPTGVGDWILRQATFVGFKHDVKQDFKIWKNKTYVERPVLAKGDGPVPHYRKWCRQFYAPTHFGAPREAAE